MSRYRRIALTFVVCVGILAAAAQGFFFLLGQRPVPEKRVATEQVYNVQVFDAEARNLQEIITAFGTARADREVIVPAQVAGEITELHDGLRVGLRLQAREQDQIAEIDKRTYEKRVQRAENQLKEIDSDIDRLNREQENNQRLLKQAREDLATIEEQYARVKKNRELGAASATEVTRALLEVRQYKQSVLQLENEEALIPVRLEASRRRQESVRADLKLAEIDLGNTSVIAPFDGVVSEVMVEKGQYVRVGDPLIRLTNIGMVEIPLPLALSDFLKIDRQLQAGQTPEVELAVNSTAPAEWRGRVVRAAPEADAGTRTVMVFVEVENPNLPPPSAEGTQTVPLLPGTFVHARISGPVLNNAILIPRDAITSGRVFVASNEAAEERKVQVGPTLQAMVVVESGVEPGDFVVLTNLDVIRDGVSLEVSDHVKLREELKRQRTKAARLLPEASE